MDNSNLYCHVIFTHSNDNVPEVIREIIQDWFFRARNEAIEWLNPHYEDWNKEYGDVDDQRDYNLYIQKKHNEILDTFNKSFPSPVKLYSDEYADIAGKYMIFGKEYTLHMGIKLINEKEWREYHRGA